MHLVSLEIDGVRGKYWAVKVAGMRCGMEDIPISLS